MRGACSVQRELRCRQRRRQRVAQGGAKFEESEAQGRIRKEPGYRSLLQSELTHMGDVITVGTLKCRARISAGSVISHAARLDRIARGDLARDLAAAFSEAAAGDKRIVMIRKLRIRDRLEGRSPDRELCG